LRVLVALAVSGLAAAAGAGTVSGRVDLVEKRGKPAENASEIVVWLEGLPAARQPLRATLRMKDKEFVPHLLVVPIGATVDFPNDDVILHNVFSVSGDNRFDLDLYKRPKSAAKTFEHPGIVRVYCNIHPQMSALIVVRDNPHYTRARPDGSFVIEGVPAGRVTVHAWHERAAASASMPVVVPDAGDARVSLQLDASKYRRARHKNKFGRDYSSDTRY
jgi:plastocyanin